MREIEYSNQYLRDLKREKKGRFSKKLGAELSIILDHLAADEPLPPKYDDHALKGDLKGFRCCHVLSENLCLIYGLEQAGIAYLARLGSHQETGLNK